MKHNNQVVTTTKPVTGLKTAPVQRGELELLFGRQVTIVDQRPVTEIALPPRTDIAPLGLAIVLANILRHPVVRGSVQCSGQVGRFARVQYEPMGQGDPEIILALVPGADRFHAAMLKFCHVRRHYVDNQWYDNALAAARAVLGPLCSLGPHPAEAELVVRWMLEKVSYGERQ